MQGRKGIPGTTCRSTEGEIMTVEEDNLAIRKEWFRLKEIVERLKKRIEEITELLVKEEKNLPNVSTGFRDFTYRYIEKQTEMKLELQKILGEEK